MKELRIGLVLYGGVALAVYINGVVTELWHALRASRAHQDDDAEASDGTAAVYRELLSELKKNPEAEDIRVVVDAVAGTSAGGVNGAALFKAVVDGADASILNRTWLEDADISKLKRDVPKAHFAIRSFDFLLGWTGYRKLVQMHPKLDWFWIRDVVYGLVSGKDPDQSPLKGEFFTGIIADTLRKMSKTRIGGPLLPNRGTFDLFLTRTDLHGWPRHLPVSDKFHDRTLYERTHAHSMALRVRPGDKDIGLEPRNNVSDFDLTYGARSTAGFPVAFAPITYEKVLTDFLAVYDEANETTEVLPSEEFDDRYLREHVMMGFPTGIARMVDGGILDNRPFTHVTKAIELKPADFQVERVVVYIEPDPEKADPGKKNADQPDRGLDWPPEEDPNFFQLAGNMFKLFRHEPILGDLRELQRRNETVRRIDAYRRANDRMTDRFVEKVLAGDDTTASRENLIKWQQRANRMLVEDPLSGYAGYVGMKLRGSADTFANILCRAANVPYDSRDAYAIRTLVRTWMRIRKSAETGQREDTLDPLASGRPDELTGNQLTLLRAFDVAFRLRRVRSLVRVINQAYDEHPARPSLDAGKRLLASVVLKYESALDDTDVHRDYIDQVLSIMANSSIDQILTSLSDDPEGFAERHGSILEQVFSVLSQTFIDISTEENDRLAEALSQLPEPVLEEAVRALIAFPFNDVSVFPLMDTAGIQDLIPVKTLRVSPYDARIVADRSDKLESAGMGAFAGFLDRELREIDLLYGRLNGAERVVELIVKSAAKNGYSDDLEALRRKFTLKAMAEILAGETADGNTRFGREVRTLKDKLAAEMPAQHEPALQTG